MLFALGHIDHKHNYNSLRFKDIDEANTLLKSCYHDENDRLFKILITVNWQAVISAPYLMLIPRLETLCAYKPQ